MTGRDDLDFYFRGMVVGSFRDNVAPATRGRHPYDPYRGPGHHDLCQTIEAGERARCFLRLPDRTRFFVATSHAPDGEIEIADVEDHPPRPWPGTEPLADVLARVAAGHLTTGEIFLPWDVVACSADAPAAVLQTDDAEELRPEADRRKLGYPVPVSTAADVLRVARECLGIDDGPGRAEALSYFTRFGLHLPRRGAKDPTARDKAELQRDRAFYDSLGAERPDEPCRGPDCRRGRVALSVFCRIHHFEQVCQRHCPFSD